jgi:hypothetical protein
MDAIKKTVNNYLEAKDYESLWKLLSAGKETEYQEWDKLRKTAYWLSFLERKSFAEEGVHGLLGEVDSLDDAFLVFDTFKKMLQRLEWWPDYDPQQVKDYVAARKISKTELIWIMDAYTLDSEYALGRYQGNKPERDLFFRDEDGIDAMCTRHREYLEKRAGVQEKVCFITCCNNENECREMDAWLERLWIPEGIETESIKIWDAPSMCSGYNEAMRSSDAKYKVYLHQDVRVLNPYFIFDIIDIFEKSPKVGLIGMMGAETIPESGVMWKSKRYGAVVSVEFNDSDVAGTIHECSIYEGGDFKAALVDGLLMCTQYDVPWRDDLFKGWDFYDASQSCEFESRGYEIIVPHQEVAWCLHDFGQIKWANYENSRRAFTDVYIKRQEDT